MALPNPVQVSGKHNVVYEAYYKQIDPKETGGIEAMVAAKFLKKSGLSDVVLSRIWDLSDPSGKGYLDKPGFYVSLKLVALAQAGQTINMANIFTETQNPPKVGEIPKPVPQRIVQSVPPSSQGDWSIKIIDRLKYEQLFESLKPVNNVLPGNKVKGVLMESKLPMDILGKIWDLADQDRDGNLDKHEFIVAMHLVYQTLAKRTVPDVLPPELLKRGHGPPPPHPPPPARPAGDANGGFVANFPTDIAPPPAVPPLPAVTAQPQPIRPPSVGAVDWVVTPAEMQKYEIVFRDSDRDKDGLVSGLEIKNVFLQSGVPQNCLAHIWALCDTNQSGKLTMEQFALAMWFVERKKVGIEPPQALAPNMVPPSMRGVIPGVDVTPQVEPKPTYTNPELEMISKEIEELAKERRILETDIAQKEADIRIKSGEVRSLQSELDTLSATLKQLEHQKGEAQKRLDDLKNQKSEFDLALEKINAEVNLTKEQVNKIRDQCTKQEETIVEQESELNSKKSELQKLKDEEANLEKEYSSNQKELDDLTKKLQDTQLEISQVRSMVTQLLEAQRQMTDALLLCRAAVEANDAVIVSDYSLQIEPDFAEARNILEKKAESPKKVENVPATTFISNTTDPFGGSTKSAFDDSFNARFDDNFGGSGFGSHDAFASDPFGDKTAAKSEVGTDDFGSDPFAALHAPTGQGQVLSPSAQKGPPPRPESPSPALPPKKAKQPPPRPAPPRPLQAPQPTTDAFGTSPSGGFADFADFDNKQASSVFQAPTKSTTAATTTPTTTAKPTDFSDDPFKDYRYEDPFSIKDPFADEDDEETSKAFFPEPSTKSPRTTPIGAVDNNNFANFDAFSSTTTVQTIHNNNNNNDSNFFDAFNDNFNANPKTTVIGNNKLDAFGDFRTTTTKSSGYKVFDENENGFEDDFFKMKLNDSTNNGGSFGTNSVNSKKSSSTNKKSSQNVGSEKISDKFADDYSKTDSFDSDLAEALKRSMAEK